MAGTIRSLWFDPKCTGMTIQSELDVLKYRYGFGNRLLSHSDSVPHEGLKPKDFVSLVSVTLATND